MDYPDPMHEASYKIHSEIFGLATTAVEWIFISYAQPLFNTIAYTIEKQGKINNKQVWGLWADNHQIWLGGEGELGIYEKGKKTKKLTLYYECRLHPQTHINVIYQDKQERLWLGTYKNRHIALYSQRRTYHPHRR